jgi:hypothetical protein
MFKQGATSAFKAEVALLYVYPEIVTQKEG